MKLYTIGHGRRTLDDFMALLHQYEITAVADVRTLPVSRWAPWFNRTLLNKTLSDAGIAYVFMGNELGGRPVDDNLYTDDGHVLYRPMSRTPLFQGGFARLLEGSARYRLAVMCSESDHHDCHRNLLIARVAAGQQVEVVHINKSGELEAFDDTLLNRDMLLGDDLDEWISKVKVR